VVVFLFVRKNPAMKKRILLSCLLLIGAFYAFAQPKTREELEKQRQQLKKEIEETEKQLNANRQQTKENLLQYQLISKKVNLQDRVIDNINRDLSVLSNNMFQISKDVKRYDRLLDTLKQEYAKSMVYAYKNRSRYDFLNFIFSASNFNDALKRMSYLRSYRNYRQMQGQNIARTQALRKKKIDELNGARAQKNDVLVTQNKEMATLAQEQKEKDRVLAELKKQGNQLNKQITAKQKQMKKVETAIAEAINRAIKEAREKAIAEEKKRKEAEKKKQSNTNTPPVTDNTPSKPTKTKPVAEKKQSILLNDENMALNASFEQNRGTLPWPLDRGVVLMHYGSNTLPSGTVMNVSSITVSADVGTSVKSVFDGKVTEVRSIEDMTVVIIQHGKYFTVYSNLKNVTVQKGQSVKTGQVIGKVAENFDGVGAIDFYIQNESSYYDPERWLRRR
jgi:septal ring factor EnvC (AmiA/AmiB activator)